MTMAEYIERDAILESIAKKHGTRNDIEEQTALDIWDGIKKIPTADVVEVVRCKDCKYFKTDSYYCQKTKQGYCEFDNNVKQKQGYCSYGERRCEE